MYFWSTFRSVQVSAQEKLFFRIYYLFRLCLKVNLVYTCERRYIHYTHTHTHTHNTYIHTYTQTWRFTEIKRLEKNTWGKEYEILYSINIFHLFLNTIPLEYFKTTHQLRKQFKTFYWILKILHDFRFDSIPRRKDNVKSPRFHKSSEKC